MTTLIFGGAGFIGANLITHLQSAGEDVVVFDNLSMGNQVARANLDVSVVVSDMADYSAVLRTLKSVKPRRVFHLAANSDIAASAVNPKIDLRNTLGTTVQLAAALRACPAEEVVFASSSAVYGEVTGEITESTVTRPSSAYGWMKLASEEVLSELAKEVGFEKYLCVRFPNVTGKWQTHGVVRDLVRKLKASPSKLNVLGDGTQLKPYALAEDLVAAIEKVMSGGWSGILDLNLSPSSQTSVREIVSKLVETSGLSPQVEYGSSRAGWFGDVPEYSYDTSKAQDLIGDLGFRSSNDAISESVSWEWENG